LLDILAQVRKEHPELQTIIVTGFANVQSAIETMQWLGALTPDQAPNFEELGMRAEGRGGRRRAENRRLRFQVQRGWLPTS
jgi:DNA-binding NtrC family response regulator